MPIRPIRATASRAMEFLKKLWAKRKISAEKTLQTPNQKAFDPKTDRPKERGKGAKIDLNT
ncbi:MAG: hypothetical protein AABW85_04850 [archaeon]